MDKTTILLSEDWVGAYGSDLRLKLSPGRHTVQLVMFVSDPVPPEAVPGTRPIPRQLRIESNVVAIEVLPKGERDGTVEDESDAATSLQAELDELWLQRDQGLAAAEAFGKRLLEKYTKREEKPLIYYQLAEIYAQSGQADPNKIVEFARQGWWYLNDPVKKARLFIYWGDALQSTKGRRDAGKIYLRGLQFCLQYGLPKEKPELPTVSRYTADGPAEEVEKHNKENKRQIAARKHVKLIGELIEHRQVLTGRIVQLYAPLPDAFDELHELVMKYLGSEQACQQIIAAAKSYRNDPEMAIPVIMRIGGDPNPRADLDWGQETKGIRVRLRADTRSWGAGGVPKFKLDVRNDGSHILLLTSAPDCWGVEVDGVWYRVTIPMLGGAKGMSFGPDKRWYNLELSLDKALGPQNENGGIELAPGLHTVRAALASGLSEDGKMLSVGAVSDPVEIEIVPAKAKSAVPVEAESVSFAQECAKRIMEAYHQEQPKQDHTNYITESLIYHIDSNDLTREKKEQQIKGIVESIKEQFHPNLGHNLAIAGFSDRMIIVDIYKREKKSDVQVEFEGKAGSVVQGKVLGPRGEPVNGATVELQIFVGGDVDDMANYRAQRVFTDANGLYVFEGLEVGSAHIGRAFNSEDGSISGVPYGLMFDFEVEPGKSYDITLGGKGRPVAGRLVPASGNAGDIDWSKVQAYFDLRAGPFSMGAWESNAKMVRAMIKEEGGNLYSKNPVKINPDGTFRIDNVRAGHYMLRVVAIEEPKRDGFNLFHDVRIPLMRDGTTETPFNLGALAVSHGDYKAPRHIDNLFLGSFELDKDIPVILKARNDEEPDVVSTKSISFKKDGESVTAALNIEWKSIVADRWQATLKFRSENGSTLARSDVFFKTSKIIERYAGLYSESLHFAPGHLSDLSKVKYFYLTIQPVREQLTVAVQKERDALNAAVAIKQVEVEKSQDKQDVPHPLASSHDNSISGVDILVSEEQPVRSTDTPRSYDLTSASDFVRKHFDGWKTEVRNNYLLKEHTIKEEHVLKGKTGAVAYVWFATTLENVQTKEPKPFEAVYFLYRWHTDQWEGIFNTDGTNSRETEEALEIYRNQWLPSYLRRVEQGYTRVGSSKTRTPPVQGVEKSTVAVKAEEAILDKKVPTLKVLDSETQKPISNCSFTFTGWGRVVKTNSFGIFNNPEEGFAERLDRSHRLILWHPDYDYKVTRGYKADKDGVVTVLLDKGGDASLEVKVSLTVRGKKSDHLPRVKLLNVDNKAVRLIISSHDSTYRFSGLAGGAYTIEAYFCDSYPTFYEKIQLSAGEHKNVSIHAQTDEVARIRVAGRIINKKTNKGIEGLKIHFVGAPGDDARTNKDGAFSTMADRARFHQCLIMGKGGGAQVEMDNHIKEDLAKKLAIHIDPDSPPARRLRDDEGDGVFCDALDCKICATTQNEPAVPVEGVRLAGSKLMEDVHVIEGLMPAIKLALEGCLGERPRLPRLLNKPGPGILKGTVKDTADTYYHMAKMFFVPVESWPGKPTFYYLAVVNESFEITGIPPGSYYLFAIEAQNTESIDAVGLPIDWPRPVTINANGKVAHVEIEMSTFLSKKARFWNVQGFLRGVGHLNSVNARTEELGPYGRVVDAEGKPIPYAKVQVREFKANRGSGGIASPDARTNEQGYYGLRPLDYPYFIGAIVHEPLINAAGYRWQYIQRNKVFEGKQAINFKFGPWPSLKSGGGIIEGTVVDANNNPIPSFIVDVRPAGPLPKVNETSEP
ncbi:MAG: hypothetical protein ACYS67_14015, partial [Planctomycetota bacterium]